MAKRDTTQFYCEVCGRLCASEEEATACESLPKVGVLGDSLKVGDKVFLDFHNDPAKIIGVRYQLIGTRTGEKFHRLVFDVLVRINGKGRVKWFTPEKLFSRHKAMYALKVRLGHKIPKGIVVP